MNQLTVGISDCLVSRDPDSTLTTYALGSCIALLLHDPAAGIAGLLHFMLPESRLDLEKARARPCMFADTGIPLLFHRAYDLGALKQRLIVSAVGGAQMLDSGNTFSVGHHNELALRKILRQAGVQLRHQDIGGALPRTVRMDVRTGKIVVTQGRQERQISQETPDKERFANAL